jgi:hypothetical protein
MAKSGNARWAVKKAYIFSKGILLRGVSALMSVEGEQSKDKDKGFTVYARAPFNWVFMETVATDNGEYRGTIVLALVF